MEDHIIPADVRNKVLELGFYPTSYIPLYEKWSVVGIRDDRHFNIQLNLDLSVSSIHQLRYRWNATGAKILDVTRILVEQKA